jgi:hypothetical protein
VTFACPGRWCRVLHTLKESYPHVYRFRFAPPVAIVIVASYARSGESLSLGIPMKAGAGKDPRVTSEPEAVATGFFKLRQASLQKFGRYRSGF